MNTWADANAPMVITILHYEVMPVPSVVSHSVGQDQ